jgi:hypothetical protein
VRLRLQIARLELESGDYRGAWAELHAARTVADEMGARKLRADCAALDSEVKALNA